MAYVSVDIDLDDIDTGELCDELEDRLQSYGRKKLSEKQKQDLKKELDSLYHTLNLSVESPEVKTLDDKLKMSHLKKVWSKYQYYEIEQKLPE